MIVAQLQQFKLQQNAQVLPLKVQNNIPTGTVCKHFNSHTTYSTCSVFVQILYRRHHGNTNQNSSPFITNSQKSVKMHRSYRNWLRRPKLIFDRKLGMWFVILLCQHLGEAVLEFRKLWYDMTLKRPLT